MLGLGLNTLVTSIPTVAVAVRGGDHARLPQAGHERGVAQLDQRAQPAVRHTAS